MRLTRGPLHAEQRRTGANNGSLSSDTSRYYGTTSESARGNRHEDPEGPSDRSVTDRSVAAVHLQPSVVEKPDFLAEGKLRSINLVLKAEVECRGMVYEASFTTVTRQPG